MRGPCRRDGRAPRRSASRSRNAPPAAPRGVRARRTRTNAKRSTWGGHSGRGRRVQTNIRLRVGRLRSSPRRGRPEGSRDPTETEREAEDSPQQSVGAISGCGFLRGRGRAGSRNRGFRKVAVFVRWPTPDPGGSASVQPLRFLHPGEMRHFQALRPQWGHVRGRFPEFHLRRSVKSADASVCGFGVWEFHPQISQRDTDMEVEGDRGNPWSGSMGSTPSAVR